MKIRIRCTGCKKALGVPDHLIGKRIKCPLCSAVVLVEAAAEELASEAAPSRSAGPQSIQTRPSRAAGDPLRADRTGEVPAPLSGSHHGKSDRLEFKVNIQSDPAELLKGRYQGTVSAEGLRLRHGAETVLLIPVGSPAEHLGGNRLAVSIDGRMVKLALSKITAYQARLAEDLADYLNGERGPLRSRDYAIPWYMLAPAALPLGIPIITLGGAIPVAAGLGLAGACLGTVRMERWPASLRLLASFGLAGLGYALLAAFFLALGFNFSFGKRQLQAEWQEFTSPDGKCSALMPGRPKAENHTEPAATGPIQIKLFLVELGPEKAYLLTYNDLPEMLRNAPPDVMLVCGRDGAVRSMNGQLLKDKSIEFGNRYPGREYLIQVPGKGNYIQRAFLVDNRLYQQAVIGKNLQTEDEDVQKYFNSFRLNPESK